MKCEYLLKHGWKGKKTYNRGDKPQFLFLVHPSSLPLTLFRRNEEPSIVTREMIEKMDDDLIKKTGYFLSKTWITKDGLEECGGDIIASVEVENDYGDYDYNGPGWIEINYTCNKCKNALKVYSDIWKEGVGREKLLPQVFTTVEGLNEFLTEHIKRI